MTIDFSDFFWGEGPKNNGIDVLFQNLKYGVTTTKDVSDFLRERSSVEETHSRALGKLSKIASNGCPHGSFAPLWQFLKTSSEKLSSAHVLMAQKVEELMKELSKYAEELQKKHKTVKEEEASTIEAVQLYQNSKTMVSKTKAAYMQRFLEFEKCQKENVSQKDIEKAEIKMKKAHEEYKTWIDKYHTCTEDYLLKFSKACQHFQSLESVYLKQMKDFLENYASLMENSHDIIGQVHVEFREMCSQMSVEELLLKFVNSKTTGKERPSPLEIEDIPTADAISQRSGSSEDKSSVDKAPIKREGNKSSNSNFSKGTDFQGLDMSSVLGQFKSNSTAVAKISVSREPLRGSKWFLRGRKGKKKDKKAEQNGQADKLDGDKDDSAATPVAFVDEEGYSVRPQECSWETQKNNFYSSSDTDSDEEPERRLHVEIKPLTNGTVPLSASVDELRNTMENITLSPIGLNGRKNHIDTESQIKRSQSVSQQIGNTSPPSHPPVNPYTPLSSPQQSTSTEPNQNNSTSRYADLGDLFAEVGEIQPAIFEQPKPRKTPTPSGLARPRPEPLLQRNTSTPSPIVSRTESVNSLESKSISQFVGSRGPSPLTLGMNDSVPLAVAFHEIIHAYFKGNDENKCQVKMTGDMMVSFPAGIIQVFASNPSPPQLTFKVRSKRPLEVLETKLDLVNLEQTEDELRFDFDMSALMTLLRAHVEKTPQASYFNIDLLKYQIKPKVGATSCPLHLVAFWKCETNQTDLRIDYKYNSHATESSQSDPLTPKNNASGIPLVQVCIASPVDGGVKSMQSKPTGQWFPQTNRACWKISSLSSNSDNLGVGSLRARFEISEGPSTRGTIAAQFSGENSTLSGCEVELLGSGYRVSLVKKRFVSGKYICDAEDSTVDFASPQ